MTRRDMLKIPAAASMAAAVSECKKRDEIARTEPEKPEPEPAGHDIRPTPAIYPGFLDRL